jgi:DNA-binding response OmpR family regulator
VVRGVAFQRGVLRVHQPTVLICEDDLPTCHALRKLLTAEGFDVRYAHSIADALKMMAELWADFVLLDLFLAHGDATGLIDIFLAERKPTKIAVLSGSVDAKEPSREQIARADRVFIKPIVIEPLLAWLAENKPIRREASPGERTG